MVVSMPPSCRALCAKKFALRGLMCACARKSSPCTLKTSQNRRFYACWASFFAETRLEGRCWANYFAEEPREGPCWASFFAEMPLEARCWASFFAPTDPAPRSCGRGGALQAGCGGGFCSIRSWLAACRRRVVPLVTPFPPFGGGPAAPSAASARAPSRRTSPRRARRRSSTTTSSRRRRNMSAALDRLKQQNEPE